MKPQSSCSVAPILQYHLVALVTGLAILLPVSQAFADPTLTVGTASGQAGGTIDITLSFTPGTTPVSTLQGDLILPAGVSYASITTAQAAAEAGKSVSANMVGGHALRVLVFGINQNAIGAGALAIVRLTIAPTVTPGTFPIPMTGIVTAAPDTTGVTASGAAGAVTVTAGSGVGTGSVSSAPENPPGRGGKKKGTR